MAAEREGVKQERGGDPRGGDRRGGDRRAVDRRAPPPAWRRPWALVSYGVLGALALVLLFDAMGGDDEPSGLPKDVVDAAPAAPPAQPSRPASGPPVEAFGSAGFERMVIAGPAAVGQRVRTQLYCDAPSPVALRQQVQRVEPQVSELLSPEGRVVAATCKWGSQGDERREDFLLLVPPDLADDFSAQPVTSDDFVRRRRILAEVEWIGRSESLSLRTAGVLRGVLAR